MKTKKLRTIRGWLPKEPSLPTFQKTVSFHALERQKTFQLLKVSAIIGLMIAYVLFVPIIPFKSFYIIDLNSSPNTQQFPPCNSPGTLVHFDALSRPAVVSSASGNFEVWGVQSVSAALTNFGAVSNSGLAPNPIDTYMVYPYSMLYVVTVPATIIVGLVIALVLLWKAKSNHQVLSMEAKA